MAFPKSRQLQHRPRVHVLGLGSIGTFAAHCLSEIPDGPAITLLLHRRSLLDAYRNNGLRISLETKEGKQIISEPYDFETLQDGLWHKETPMDLYTESQPDTLLQGKNIATDMIENLIVCVKSIQTVDALLPLQYRLNSQSTILFLQNGSGMIDAVNKHLFPSPQTRPDYLIGVISHGITLNKPFDITHTGFSATSIGPALQEDNTSVSSSSKSPTASHYLLRALPKSHHLNATAYPYTSILQIQLEKLAVNAFCNPLCALNDSINGFLFTIPDTRRKILTEISNVVLALPALEHVPGVRERFSVDTLEETVNDIIRKTYNTTCSMVWDLRAQRETEVRFINGSWSKMGREVGVETPVNDQLVQEIEARTRKSLLL